MLFLLIGLEGTLKETFFNFDNDEKNKKNQEFWISRTETKNFDEMKIKLKIFEKKIEDGKIFLLML